MIQNLSKKRTDEGFTLIELLVVIVILGILAAVVVFAVGGLGDKGQSDACKNDARALRTAEEAYYAKKGTYATEAVLANTAGTAGEPKFIAEVSTLHDITVTGTGATATYSVTPISPCTV